MTDSDALALTPLSAFSGTLAQRVTLSLKQAILRLDLPPGTRLQRQQIADTLGVSRAPVAEAFARLAADRLVDVVPQSGTRVSRFSMDEIREASFMRAALEVAAAKKVAASQDTETLALLTRGVRLQALLLEDRDFAGFFDADEAFHKTILQATGFAGLADEVAAVSLPLMRPRILLLPGPGRLSQTLSEHRAVVEAIRAHDAAAAGAALDAHIGRLAERLAPLEAEHPDYFR